MKLALFSLAILATASSDAQGHALQGTWSARYIPTVCNGQSYATHFDHPSVVPVKLNNSLEFGVQRIFKESGGTFSILEVREQLELALVNFNDSIGIPVRLVYGGETAMQTEGDAIVISTSDDQDYGFPASGTPFGSCNGFSGKATGGKITVVRFGPGHNPRTWRQYPSFANSLDLWVLFGQELGHALGMMHPTDPVPMQTVLDTSNPPATYQALDAIMSTSFQQRHWTRYERETLTYAYGIRVGTYRSYAGFGTLWDDAGTGFPQSLVPQLRSGRVTEGTSSIGIPVVEYPGATSAPHVDGMLRPLSGYTTLYTTSPIIATFSPPAAAVDQLNSDWRIFYLSTDLPTPAPGGGVRPYGSALKRICWRTSSDGSTWSNNEVCPTIQGAYIETTTDAVSASFDRYRKVFVLTWINTDYLIRVLTIPGQGSSQASQVYSTFGHYSWEAPTVSCRHADPGCMMTFMSYSPTGYLITLKGDVTSSGTWSTTNTFSDFYDFDQSATPNVTYRPYNDSFALAFLKRDMKTIRAYRRYWNDTVSWHTPKTVYSSSAGSVSAPAIGTQQSSTKTSRYLVTFLEFAQ